MSLLLETPEIPATRWRLPTPDPARPRALTDAGQPPFATVMLAGCGSPHLRRRSPPMLL
jgi:hypothetical protein